MTRSATSSTGLRALFAGGAATGLTDGQFLDRFRERQGPDDPAAEAAFAALVDRHAAMVWGVCRRSLARADAEDAFQATFLVLVRRAGSLRVDGRGSAGRWLYGVARKVAARLRREAARRPPTPAEPTQPDDPADLAERRDVRDAVAAELDRLPPKYRRPIELCDFEGLTYEQAGLSLGWPTATIKSRLARGRVQLRRGLARRGLAPAAAAAIAGECRAGVPKALIPSTIRAWAIASGLLPAAVARLAEGVLRTMLWDKLKPIALLLLAAAGTASAVVVGPPEPEAPQEAPKPAAADPAPPAPGPDPRYMRTLSNGTEVEILAVSGYGPDPKTWWRPDGTPLAEAPCDSLVDQMNRSTSLHEIAKRPRRPDEAHAKKGEDLPREPEPDWRRWGRNKIGREFLFRASGAGSGNVSAGEYGGGGGFSSRVTHRGEVVSNLKLCSAGFPKDQTTASIRLYSNHAPWKLRSSGNKIGASSYIPEERDKPSRLFFTSSYDDQGRALITVAHNFDPNEMGFQVRIVDQEGGEHIEGAGNVVHSQNLHMETKIFKLPREQIREFRIMTQPIEAIEFADVALNPRKADDPR